MATDSVTWSVFDPEGTWLSDVRLTAGAKILEIDDGLAIVLVRNELDVESIEVRSVERPGG